MVATTSRVSLPGWLNPHHSFRKYHQPSEFETEVSLMFGLPFTSVSVFAWMSWGLISIYPGRQRPLKERSPGIVDGKPLLKQYGLFGKTIQKIVVALRGYVYVRTLPLHILIPSESVLHCLFLFLSLKNTSSECPIRVLNNFGSKSTKSQGIFQNETSNDDSPQSTVTNITLSKFQGMIFLIVYVSFCCFKKLHLPLLATRIIDGTSGQIFMYVSMCAEKSGHFLSAEKSATCLLENKVSLSTLVPTSSNYAKVILRFAS